MGQEGVEVFYVVFKNSVLVSIMEQNHFDKELI